MLPPTDTRRLFRPLCGEIVALLRGLSPADWHRPTLAGRWRVRDIVAHLLDTALRRLSYQRDKMAPPPPPHAIRTEADLLALINDLNRTWIDATARFSPRVLCDLYAGVSADLCEFVEGLPEDAPALFAVSWAGQSESPAWLDLGREFTEVWHHGAQIREAVAAGPFPDPRWLRAVLEIAMHALPHSYRHVPARPGASLSIEISGASGGSWRLEAREGAWDVSRGLDQGAAAAVRLSDDTAWRLFFNALPPGTAADLVRIDGDRALALPLLGARSVIV